MSHLKFKFTLFLIQQNSLEFLDPFRRWLEERAVHLDFLVFVNTTRLGAVGMVGDHSCGVIRLLQIPATLGGMLWVDTRLQAMLPGTTDLLDFLQLLT